MYLLLLIDRFGSRRESEVGMEGLVPEGPREPRLTLWRHDAEVTRPATVGIIFCLDCL